MIQTHGTSMTSAHYSRLGPQECEKIHLASLEILRRTGVDVHDEKARQILVEGGAQADGLRVHLPEYMVARALVTAPKSITLYDRNGKVAMRAGKYNTYFGGGSDCLNILDHHTGQRRRPLITDVMAAARLMDSLPEIDFVMSAFLPDESSLAPSEGEIMDGRPWTKIIGTTLDLDGRYHGKEQMVAYLCTYLYSPKEQLATLQLTGANGAHGWLNGELFVKRSQAEGAVHSYSDFGCSFETFTNADFLELETLGPLMHLQPGESVTHTELWNAHKNIHLTQWDEDELDRVIAPLVK